ncbi:MAG: hypothetical protein FWD02_06525 [Bacteroidales bacterium]|nr:hypothetical protein [Bacteroidales bacterium]
MTNGICGIDIALSGLKIAMAQIHRALPCAIDYGLSALFMRSPQLLLVSPESLYENRRFECDRNDHLPAIKRSNVASRFFLTHAHIFLRKIWKMLKIVVTL